MVRSGIAEWIRCLGQIVIALSPLWAWETTIYRSLLSEQSNIAREWVGCWVSGWHWLRLVGCRPANPTGMFALAGFSTLCPGQGWRHILTFLTCGLLLSRYYISSVTRFFSFRWHNGLGCDILSQLSPGYFQWLLNHTLHARVRGT